MAGIGATAAIITIGDEVVEGRITNENGAWLSAELMSLGIWPRLSIAVPDDDDLIVRLLRIAADVADVVIVCGGLGFTPDDITRRSVATAFFRELHVDHDLAAHIQYTCRWATIETAHIVSTFPVGAEPIASECGGVPGFSLSSVHVLPGSPSEMRSMFRALRLPVSFDAIATASSNWQTTEDRIYDMLSAFDSAHPTVRLGSYPNFAPEGPSVGIVLASRSRADLEIAEAWVQQTLSARLRRT